MTMTIKMSVLLGLCALLFIPVYAGLLESWLSNSNNSHGLLVPGIALYLVWQKREALRQTPPDSSWWGVVLLAASLGFYVLSYAGGIALTMRISMIGTLLGLVLFVLGPALFRQLLFPLLFLLFMVPLPDSIVGMIAFPMQLFATSVSAFLIQMVSIPVWQEGNMLYFVQTQLEVAESCSGLRSLLSLTMLSVLFAYTLDQSWPRKWLLVLSAIPIALLANIVRVSGTGVLAHFYGSQVAKGFLHSFSGIVVFLFGLMLLGAEYYLLVKFSGPRAERNDSSKPGAEDGRNE